MTSSNWYKYVRLGFLLLPILSEMHEFSLGLSLEGENWMGAVRRGIGMGIRCEERINGRGLKVRPSIKRTSREVAETCNRRVHRGDPS